MTQAEEERDYLAQILIFNPRLRAMVTAVYSGQVHQSEISGDFIAWKRRVRAFAKGQRVSERIAVDAVVKRAIELVQGVVN